MRFGTLVLLSCLLASCASIEVPSLEAIKGAQIGNPPAIGTVKEAVNAFLDEVLKDPMSKVVKYGDPTKGFYTKDRRSRSKFAWLVRCQVNARNSYGGYTGFQPYDFFFLEDTVVALGTQEVLRAYGNTPYYMVTEIGKGGLTAEEAGIPQDH